MRRVTRRFRIGVVAAVPAAGVAVACDKSPLFAPTQSTVTLAASRLVLPVNGVGEIIASVIEQSGTAVQNGTVVTFTSTLGTIEPREARTAGGKVTVRLHAGTESSTATVGAFSGDASADTIDILIGGAAAADVIVTARPGTVSAKGGSVEIIASVADASGNRLSGVPVTFTASAGTLSRSSRVTDANGEARVTLQTNQQTTVTVTAGGQQETVTVEVTNAPTVSITAGASPVEDQPTDFTVVVAAGSSPIRAVTIKFGDGQAQALGALDGTATVSHVYRRAGTFVVTVTATDTVGESTTVTTTVTIAAATPPSVTITPPATSPVTDEPAIFAITVTAGSSPVASLSVNFGDGQSQSVGTGRHPCPTSTRRAVRSPSPPRPPTRTASAARLPRSLL